MAGTAEGVMFSLTDFAVKLPADVSWTDVDWVLEASYKGSHQQVELYGDGKYKDTLNFNQKGELTVKATKAAMATLEKITGKSATQSGGYDRMQIHTADELTPPVICVRITTNLIDDATGVSTPAYVYFYKTKCTGVFEGFLGFANGKACELQLTFSCLDSDKDENNVALAENSFGDIRWATS